MLLPHLDDRDFPPMNRYSGTTLFSLVFLFALVAQGSAASEETPEILSSLRPDHPRLLLTSETWEKLRVRRSEDPTLEGLLHRGEVEARALLGVPPVIYEKEGIRLLDVSRTVLRRVLLLALHYEMTGDLELASR